MEDKNVYCEECYYYWLWEHHGTRCEKVINKIKEKIISPEKPYIKITEEFANNKGFFDTNKNNKCKYYKKKTTWHKILEFIDIIFTSGIGHSNIG